MKIKSVKISVVNETPKLTAVKQQSRHNNERKRPSQLFLSDFPKRLGIQR